MTDKDRAAMIRREIERFEEVQEKAKQQIQVMPEGAFFDSWIHELELEISRCDEEIQWLRSRL